MAGKIAEVKWGESAEELYGLYRAEADVGRRKRLHTLWLVRQGVSAREAAHQAGVGERTLLRWLEWYRAKGLSEVLGRVPGHGALGSLCRLTAEQQEDLRQRSAKGQFRTTGQVRDWVQTHWGVHYRESGMYSVLARLTIHPKVPRPQAEKADTVAQEDWKKGGSPPS
jgi:transposase